MLQDWMHVLKDGVVCVALAGGSVSALATGPDSTASVFSSAVASGGATALANAIAEAASSKFGR